MEKLGLGFGIAAAFAASWWLEGWLTLGEAAAVAAVGSVVIAGLVAWLGNARSGL